MSKKVNVCICVKDRQAALKTTLDNLLKQTYDNFDILACDGLSRDMTMNVILDYYEKNKKVIPWQTPAEGYVNTHNYILSQCDGDYICFCGSDDFATENKIAEQVKYLEEHPDVDVISTSVMFPDKKVLANSMVELNNDQITDALKNNFPMNTICHFETVMFRRKCLEQFTNKKYFFDEYETGRCGEGFLYTLHFLGYKFANIITTAYVYTKGLIKDSMSNTIVPEFANTVDTIDYEYKKGTIIELFNKYNPKVKKRGRPKKSA